jgi:hypothetical protein
MKFGAIKAFEGYLGGTYVHTMYSECTGSRVPLHQRFATILDPEENVIYGWTHQAVGHGDILQSLCKFFGQGNQQDLRISFCPIILIFIGSTMTIYRTNYFVHVYVKMTSCSFVIL